MELIGVKGLFKSYGHATKRVNVLNGIDFGVAPGETVSIVGASGVGKSTLLNIMGALDRPTRGDVYYKGTAISGLDDRGLAEFRNKTVGFVFQFHHLLPEFTALENVMLPALIGGSSRAEAEEAARGLLTEVGLGERLTHKPGELSGGEQQRCAIVRALVQSPEAVLADEPTGNLDTRTAGEVFELLLEMNSKRGTALIVVTHNTDLADRLERKVEMVDGSIANA